MTNDSNKDNVKENPRDLWHLRHCLQFWQLRTWIPVSGQCITNVLTHYLVACYVWQNCLFLYNKHEFCWLTEFAILAMFTKGKLSIQSSFREVFPAENCWIKTRVVWDHSDHYLKHGNQVLQCRFVHHHLGVETKRKQSSWIDLEANSLSLIAFSQAEHTLV